MLKFCLTKKKIKVKKSCYLRQNEMGEIKQYQFNGSLISMHFRHR